MACALPFPWCLWPLWAPILPLIRATVKTPIRLRDHAFGRPYSLSLYSWTSCGKSWTPLHFPPLFIHSRGPSLSCQVPPLSFSLSLRLNGGKGYKVSPQRPIQSTVYSGNLTPAAVSAPASDHYRVVREKVGVRRKRSMGLRGSWWASYRLISKVDWDFGRFQQVYIHNKILILLQYERYYLTLSLISWGCRDNKSTTKIFP